MSMCQWFGGRVPYGALIPAVVVKFILSKGIQMLDEEPWFTLVDPT